jgi:hypothetical protein
MTTFMITLPELWQLALIVLMDEGYCGHQNVGITIRLIAQ